MLWLLEDQNTDLRYDEGSMINDKIITYRKLFTLFDPPKTVKDLIAERDSKKYPKCKN